METLRSYPHQLSTGMLQRISIALAALNKPKVILADEPTSALDAIHRSRALELLTGECDSHGASLVIATHDLSVAQRYTENIIVLFNGCVIEQSPTAEFFKQPLHPYSKRLLRRPGSLKVRAKDGHDGNALSEGEAKGTLAGCEYQVPCLVSRSDCREWESRLLPVNNHRSVRCIYWK